MSVTRKDDSQDDEQDSYFLAKPFWLFNVAQVDGLPTDLTAPPETIEFHGNQQADQS